MNSDQKAFNLETTKDLTNSTNHSQQDLITEEVLQVQ